MVKKDNFVVNKLCAYLLLKRPDSLQVFCIATSLLNVFVALGSFLSTYNGKYRSFLFEKGSFKYYRK